MTDNTTRRAWYCTHRETISVGERREHAEIYCRANRLCEVGPEGCHAILVTKEFLSLYKGPIYGTELFE